MTNKTDEVFWLDKFEGAAKSGIYTRCNLNQCIKILNEKGARIVGIKLDMESAWNLELIMEVTKEEAESDGTKTS